MVLDWRDRGPEFHHKGFSPKIYRAFREIVLPFPKIEHDMDKPKRKGTVASSRGFGSRRNWSPLAIGIPSVR